MAKRIDPETRVLEYFKSASQADCAALMRTIRVVCDVRFPATATVSRKRGRPAKAQTGAQEAQSS